MIYRSTKSKKEERVASHYFYLLIWSLQPGFDFVWFCCGCKTHPTESLWKSSEYDEIHLHSLCLFLSLCLSLSWGAGVSWRRRVHTCCCTFVWCSKMYWTVFVCVSFLCLWWSICNGSIKGKGEDPKKKKGKSGSLHRATKKKTKSTQCYCNGTEERERERESQTNTRGQTPEPEPERERGLKRVRARDGEGMKEVS